MGNSPTRTSLETRRTLPAWLLSLMIHLGLMLVFAFMVRAVPPGAAEEPGRTVGIVLKQSTDEGEIYEGEQNPTATDSTTSPAQEMLDALPEEVPGFDVAEVLPTATDVLGTSALDGGSVGDASTFTLGSTGRANVGSAGKARVRVFGVEGEGRKFVYVFDRSVSMSGSPLAAAKHQLLSSLESLGSTHQFQIIFFNDRRWVFSTGKVPFATDRNKQLARKFVGGITADGGTDRPEALRLALRRRPDVVFFLTDADDPMSDADLSSIRRRNRGRTAIHAIEFGVGPSIGRNNFLVRLARENGGHHVYVDIRNLGRP